MYWPDIDHYPILHERMKRLRRFFNSGKGKKLRAYIFERDKHECQHCQKTDDLTLDHIVPLYHGGDNMPHNLQILCSTCNNIKNHIDTRRRNRRYRDYEKRTQREKKEALRNVVKGGLYPLYLIAKIRLA